MTGAFAGHVASPDTRATESNRDAATGETPARCEAQIALEKIRFSYPDGTEVIAGIDLVVRAGEILGIVGPSGCGKSTLLSLMAGLAAPTSGDVRCLDNGSGRHLLSMVFQKDTLMPWATAAENVRMFARFRRHELRKRPLTRLRRNSSTPEAERALVARVDELLALAHLDQNADSYPYQLSGGMRRRVAFLTGIAPNPQILLLDEPFSAVDEPTRVGIHQDVSRILRMTGTTTILVTHDLAEAATLCDRVLILSDRPAVIAHEHNVPFGDDRDMLELRESQEFLQLYGKLWRDLSEQMTVEKHAARGGTDPEGRPK